MTMSVTLNKTVYRCLSALMSAVPAIVLVIKGLEFGFMLDAGIYLVVACGAAALGLDLNTRLEMAIWELEIPRAKLFIAAVQATSAALTTFICVRLLGGNLIVSLLCYWVALTGVIVVRWGISIILKEVLYFAPALSRLQGR